MRSAKKQIVAGNANGEVGHKRKQGLGIRIGDLVISELLIYCKFHSISCVNPILLMRHELFQNRNDLFVCVFNHVMGGVGQAMDLGLGKKFQKTI